MAHSPHSSLSTPTPASSTGIVMPAVTPRQALPTPPIPDTFQPAQHARSATSPSKVLDSSSVALSTVSSSASSPSRSAPRPNVASSSSHASPISSSNSFPRSPSGSPASSQYPSSLDSPERSARCRRRRRADSEETEVDSTDSSDVEIYLSSFGPDDSIPRMHPAKVSSEAEPAPEESSALPRVDFSEQRVADITSPQLPPAPAQPTIPLPNVEPVAQPDSAPAVFFDIDSSTIPLPVQQDFQFQQDTSRATNASLLSHVHSPKTNTNDLHETLFVDKTPNVYINGLPPHFPEDQLYALAAPFGTIRSVRTFTRHVRDSESGYGFVLFETIEAAERCITSLRRYRNLHPTFSKQIHKIPGTPYAHLNLQLDHNAHSAWDHESCGQYTEEASFKAKMASLADPDSTNLYMEGLPLSIDEPTLAALVSPHRIVSSRFFQTRLSNPPRIIAFVRLETRAAAEEIIERLHGRMVRGWNDPGSRISVRFSDTAEQRELRRSERAAREGEQSPARLTIAQAALLNLRGQELRNQISPDFTLHPPIPALPNRYPNEINNRLHYSSPLPYHTPPFTVDYSLAPGRHYPSSRTHTPSHTSPYHVSAHLPQESKQPTMEPTMAALLDSLNNGAAFQNNHPYSIAQTGYRDRPFVGRDAQEEIDLTFDHIQHTRPRPVQARNGYTATEEFIMRAHAEATAHRRKPPPLDSTRHRRGSDANINIGMGMRGFRTQASTISVHQPHHDQALFSPAVGERHSLVHEGDEFHTSPAAHQNMQNLQQTQAQVNSDGHRHGVAPKHNHRIHPAHVNARLSRDLEASQQTQKSPSFGQLSASTTNRVHYQQAHLRSTTLPHRTTSTSTHLRHYQHNSLSSNVGSTNHQNSNNNHAVNKNLSSRDPIIIYDNDHADGITIRGGNTKMNYDSNSKMYHHGGGGAESNCHYRDQRQHVYDTEQTSPPLISPSLTYSSHTPSTLSPATPFFGSFGSQAESFEQPRSGHSLEPKKARTGSH